MYEEEIDNHEFMFDINKKYCDILEKGNITIKEVQDFFNMYFINNIARLDVEYVSHNHWEANEEKLKENNAIISNQILKIKMISILIFIISIIK